MRNPAKTSLLFALLISSSYLLFSTCGGSAREQTADREEVPAESTAVQPIEDDLDAGSPLATSGGPSDVRSSALDTTTVDSRAQPAARATTPDPAPAQPSHVAPPAAKPQAAPLTVAAGETIDIQFRETLSSHTSQAGEPFRARITQPVLVNGKTAIPAGTAILGRVLEAEPAKKIGGRARLTLDFESLVLANGATYPIDAVFSQKGKSQTGKDAAIIGGATLGGAVLGKQVGGDTGTIIGAVAGGIGGAFAAKKTKGKPVEVPAGTEMILELTRPVTIDVLP